MFRRFVRIVEAIPFSQVEWRDAHDPSDDPVEKTVRFFVRVRQSRAGQLKEFATLSRNRIRGGMNEQTSAWMSVVDGLHAVSQRLRRVVRHRRHSATGWAKDVFFLDPPYLHETRASTQVYEYEMTDQQHRLLLDVLATVKGRFMLSGYWSKMYDMCAVRNGWNRVDFDRANHAAVGNSKRRMADCVWMNFDPEQAEEITPSPPEPPTLFA